MINSNLKGTTYFCELSQLGLITIEGPDAAKFLQGQVTSDVRELTQAVTQLGAQCNLKGRVMANFRALQMSPETIALCLSTDLIADTITSLSKYIVFSKAKLHDSTNQFTLIGLYGDEAAALAAAYFGQIPGIINGWIEHQGSYLIKLDEQRYECWITNASLTEFFAFITPQATRSGNNLWNLLDIRAGIAWVTAETRELFTPQALNYPLINAVSFRKGCYTGQEIVARMHYRGKLKKHLYRYETTGNTLPAPTDAVYNLNKEAIGEVICAAFSQMETIDQARSIGEAGNIDQAKIVGQTKKIELLASISGEHCDGLSIANTEKLKRLELPYAIPSGEEAPSNT